MEQETTKFPTITGEHWLKMFKAIRHEYNPNEITRQIQAIAAEQRHSFNTDVSVKTGGDDYTADGRGVQEAGI